MDKQQILFRWINKEQSGDLSMPCYQTTLSAGMDVAAANSEPVVLQPGQIHLFPTGFAVAIPPGYEIQVRPRSGLAIKKGITVVNSPGTIDADYRGEVRIGLINLGSAPFSVHRGDRIAQLVLAPVSVAQIKIVQDLEETERADGGFGHTGV